MLLLLVMLERHCILFAVGAVSGGVVPVEIVSLRAGGGGNVQRQWSVEVVPHCVGVMLVLKWRCGVLMIPQGWRWSSVVQVVPAQCCAEGARILTRWLPTSANQDPTHPQSSGKAINRSETIQ